MEVYNFEQKSKEWFDIRKGKMTASHAQAIGNNGKGLETYILEMMAEFYSSGEKEIYTNADMERGIELEEQARAIYEIETSNKVEQVGFCKYDEFSGCSPDGLIGEDGGIEIKCQKDNTHFKMILNGEKEIDSKYLWQIQMNLLITDRKWWDYVSYNPNFSKSLIIFRIEPDEEMQKKILDGIKKGKNKIKEINETLLHT
jgi:putative phage-type endonuclease